MATYPGSNNNAPIADRRRRVDLLTSINENPNLYTNPKPVGSTVTELAPAVRPYPLHLRTWIGPNNNLTDYFIARPPGATTADLAPARRPSSVDLRTSISENPNLYVAAPVYPAGVQTTELPPAVRASSIDRRTAINENPNLYTNPFPVGSQSTDLPPKVRPKSPDLGTSINANPNLYVAAPTTPPPGAIVADLAPNRRASAVTNRTWISGNEPGRYTNPVPSGATTTELARARAISDTRTWINENPNIYVPVGYEPAPDINSGTISIASAIAGTISIQTVESDTIGIQAAAAASITIESAEVDSISIKSVDSSTL